MTSLTSLELHGTSLISIMKKIGTADVTTIAFGGRKFVDIFEDNSNAIFAELIVMTEVLPPPNIFIGVTIAVNLQVPQSFCTYNR